jgi:putative multiple sugar transport system substrate-binding protein
MDAILAANYADGTPLHGVLSPYDGLSRGIISALRAFGFQPGTEDWPVVTGQDAEAASVSLIRTGEQFSTILKDTRDLARVAADMVEALLEGRSPEINDTSTYHNGVKIVPSYLLVPHTVDATNLQRLVIDSGYLSEADIH